MPAEAVADDDDGEAFSEKRPRAALMTEDFDGQEVEEYQPVGKLAPPKPKHINFFEELERGDNVCFMRH